MMSGQREFINPSLTVDNLDLYIVRHAIYEAIRGVLPLLSGTLLDIGCGKMPYKSWILESSDVRQYLGLDFPGGIYARQQMPDITWDGMHIPLQNEVIDCAIATEVLEHSPEPERLLRETYRILKVDGLFFFTVPFFWPLHDIPYDEYRYTPFALKRHLRNAGFEHCALQALGGWDASLAQMLGLWGRRRPMRGIMRRIVSTFLWPVMFWLIQHDSRPYNFESPSMITGLSGIARKTAYAQESPHYEHLFSA